jgi:hypothetical protein
VRIHLPIVGLIFGIAIVVATAVGASMGLLAGEEPEGPCFPAEQVPEFEPAVAEGDCVTSVAPGIAAEYVIGTRSGKLGLVRDGKLVDSAQPPGSTGAVTDINPHESFVAFVVDQGIGLFSVERWSFVQLPADAKFVSQGYVSLPGGGRPQLAEGYVKKGPDGTTQRIGFQVGTSGEACAIYMSQEGGIPSRIWCLPAETLFDSQPHTPGPRPSPKCFSELLTKSTHATGREFELQMVNGRITPAEVLIPEGTHGLRIAGLGEGIVQDWRLQSLASAVEFSCPITTIGPETIVVTLSKPGRYELVDQLHPTMRVSLIRE